MTDQEINIAIAEFCGKLARKAGQKVIFQRPDPSGVYQLIEHADGRQSPCYITDIPNYCTDLNAIHEAEKHLKPLKHNCDHCAEVCDYERNLCAIVKADASHKWSGDSFKIAHATARQRAEALLRTIGKWNTV